jgi:hypothetical protein
MVPAGHPMPVGGLEVDLDGRREIGTVDSHLDHRWVVS